MMDPARLGARLALGLALTFIVALPAGAGEPLSNRIASYAIEARLDAARHVVDGSERIVWRNGTAIPAKDLYFHLYLNAFANNHTTFLREYRASHGESGLASWNEGWGSVSIDSLRIGGEELVGGLEVAHPDDANPDDHTVVRLPLPAEVPPGGEVEIEIRFTSRLPRLLARTGYLGDFNFVAQWFPKLGVFGDRGWNCHQFHASSEFFADFGVYDVKLTVPAGYTVGASGNQQEERDNGDGTRTVRFLAEDVHDFAWTADPDLRRRSESIDGVEVLVLCHERDCREADRFFGAVRHALAWFGEHIGPYPYPGLTVVVPPPFASAAGGMEYPTLITALSPRWMPSWLRLPELVTVHEFGHQYWYGMVASNEFEEAWLDEGVNSYAEGKIMAAAYGRGDLIDLPSLRVDSMALRRGVFMSSRSRDPATRSAWEFIDQDSYGRSAYDRTALTLDTLEGYIGEESVLGGLRLYFDRWRFRHPRGNDFQVSMNESAGSDLTWFFDQSLRTSAVIDYAVTAVDVDPIEPLAGLGVETEPAPAVDTHRSSVVVERLGEARLPVDVSVVFDDGSEMHERWDGEARWRRFEYQGTHAVVRAIVDPDGRLPLDIDPVNNSRLRQAGTRGIIRVGLRWGFWFQNLLHAVTSF